MRRVTVILAVCALASASTALAVGGGSAGHPQPAIHQRHWVLPGVGHVQLPSVQGKSCFVSSADRGCSLTPCRGFVGGSPDWAPITPQCGPLQRQPAAGLFGRALPRLVTRPGGR
jgi:hypothetical protein